MDAKELTLVVNNQSDKISELEKQVKYLTQELEKQRLLMNDMKIDVCNVRIDRKFYTKATDTQTATSYTTWQDAHIAIGYLTKIKTHGNQHTARTAGKD